MSAKEGAGATPPQRPKTRPRRPIDELAGVGPDEREKMARFADAMEAGFARQAEITTNLLSKGEDFPGASNQLVYYRVAGQVLKQLAWILRTGRGGPLAGQARRGKRADDSGKG